MNDFNEQGYSIWGEEDIVGNRKLSRHRCLEMNWNNSKEITAGEIAWCIQSYADISLDSQKLRKDIHTSVSTALTKLKKEDKTRRRKEKINHAKEQLTEEYPRLDLASCKTMEQIKCIRSLIRDEFFQGIATFIKNDFKERDTQHYGDDLQSYKDSLHKALDIHRKYNHDFNDKEAVDTVENMFNELIDLGLPKPFTAKEVKIQFFEENCLIKLQEAGFATTPVKHLSKEITKIHFSR